MSRKILIVIILSILCISLTPMTAFGDDIREEAESVLEKIETLNTKINDLEIQYEEALAEQEEAQLKMQEIQTTIDEKTTEVSLLQKQLSYRASTMYRTGQITFIDVLFGSESFKSFATNWELLCEINEKDNKVIQETKELRQTIENEKYEYEKQEQLAAQKVAEAALSKEEAEQLLTDAQNTYNNLTSQVETLVQEIEEAQAAAHQSDLPQVTGNIVVDRAYAELGKPYVWGACGPNSFDCSGLVSYCLSGSYGTRLGTTGTFMGWRKISDPQPGDICTNSHHCGVYIGNGQMIHAPQSGDYVKISQVHSNMIYVRYNA